MCALRLLACIFPSLKACRCLLMSRPVGHSALPRKPSFQSWSHLATSESKSPLYSLHLHHTTLGSNHSGTWWKHSFPSFGVHGVSTRRALHLCSLLKWLPIEEVLQPLFRALSTEVEVPGTYKLFTRSTRDHDCERL